MTARSVLSRSLESQDRELFLSRSDTEGEFPQETGKYFSVAVIDSLQRVEFLSYDRVSVVKDSIVLSVTRRGIQNDPLQFERGSSVIFVGEDRVPDGPGSGTTIESTDELDEGLLNLYFTDQRAVSAVKDDDDWNASNWDLAVEWGAHGPGRPHAGAAAG